MYKTLLLAVPLAVLLLQPAHASNSDVSKPFVCAQADIIVIGTVEDIDSDWAQTPIGTIIKSAVEFDVERVIHGSAGGTITIDAWSGTIEGTSYKLSSTPLFEENDRYLLLLHSISGHNPGIVGTGTGAIRLNAAITLPTQQDLEDLWEEHCGE